MTETDKEKLEWAVNNAALKIYRELKAIQALSTDSALVNHLLQMVNHKVNYHMNGDGSIIDGVEIKEIEEDVESEEDKTGERFAPGDVHPKSSETEFTGAAGGQGDSTT